MLRRALTQGKSSAAVLKLKRSKMTKPTFKVSKVTLGGGAVMPVRKQEAHRALELLEDYHSKLVKPQDRQLRLAIERVIRIFKSRLFQALLDIQEFYELTLLDDTKSIQQKTAETIRIANKWEADGTRREIPSEETDFRALSNAFLQDNNKKTESRNETPDSTKVAPVPIVVPAQSANTEEKKAS
ncbi:hypothetical protein evm_000523 [Chilo suppressalis]|nr:hypothetical protein evm_000523 [Chilo suppressalis]